MRLVYTQEAVDDLQRLREFIEIHNPAAAAKVAQTIITGVEKLKRFPRIGIEVKHAPDPDLIRDLILGNYIIRYLLHDESIYILHLWHHKEERTGE
jgi:plasmid stabilization system protein ParE